MTDTILAYIGDEVLDNIVHEMFGVFDYAGRSAAEQSEAQRFWRAGMMQWYTPPILPGEKAPHEWSCKEDTDTLYAWPTTTGTATGVFTSVTTITATTASFYVTMVGKSIVVNSETLTIATYISSTQITVTGDHHWTGSKTFSITSDGTYDLPTTFASLAWKQFQFDSDVTRRKVVEVSSDMVNGYRNSYPTYGVPQYCYTTFKTPLYTAQHVKKVVMWPIPDAVYTLTYRVKRLPYQPDATHLYPLGGPEFSRSQLASCLAAVESRKLEGGRGPRWDEYIIALAADVETDRSNNTPQTLGMMPSGDEPEFSDALNLIQSGTVYVNA